MLWAKGIEEFFQAWEWIRPVRPYPWFDDPHSGRRLTVDGRIIIRPWTGDILEWSLLKAMPGAIFNQSTKEWQVSTLQDDIKVVLQLAKRLNLVVAKGFPKGESNG